MGEEANVNILLFQNFGRLIGLILPDELFSFVKNFSLRTSDAVLFWLFFGGDCQSLLYL